MRKEFEVHMLNDLGKGKARRIAEAFNELLNALTGEDDSDGPHPAIAREVLCPPGRELSIVKTKLEEACFFAKKAMASDPSNSG